MQQNRFGSFVITLAIVGAILGALTGVAGFILSVVGGEVFIELGSSLRLTGVPAGIVGLPLMPVVFSLIGALVGLFCYLPYKAIRGLA